MGTCDFIAGWSGGVFGLVTGHPFDTIKVNQQNLGIGMVECTKNILKTQGIKGYFRGMAFPIITASTVNAIYFGVYRVSLEQMMASRQENRLLHFSDIDRAHAQQMEQKTKENGTYSYWDTFNAGCIGGTAQLVLTCPVELVKIKLQTTQSVNGVKFRGPLDVIRHTMKTRGIRGIYQGMGITFFRDVPSSGVYMCGYAVISDWLLNLKYLKDNTSDGGPPNGLRILIAGGFAGTLSWWSIIPLDVIKSRLQADNPLNPQYKGWLDCSQYIFRKHGFKGFMRGVLPLSLRAFPVNAVTFLGYEWTNTLCHVIL